MSNAKQVTSFNSSLPEKKLHSQPDGRLVENKIVRKVNNKIYLAAFRADKKLNQSALFGFTLSLASLGILLATSPVAILFGLAGAILSLVGLRKIKKNPERYSGKGLAWGEIILGLLIPVFLIVFLLAFAGAF